MFVRVHVSIYFMFFIAFVTEITDYDTCILNLKTTYHHGDWCTDQYQTWYRIECMFLHLSKYLNQRFYFELFVKEK